MARYLFLAKYAPDALAAVRKEGYSSRPAAMDKLVASVGGSVESVYFMPSSSWDFLSIVNASSDGVFAICSVAMASGAFARTDIHELRTADEADRLISGQLDWSPPR